MRLNKYVAMATGLSRRASDAVIENGRVTVNGSVAKIGAFIEDDDKVTLDGVAISVSEQKTTLILNKPVGYVCSRNGQGSKTIYDLLPKEYWRLKPVGRLDKDSSGLLLLTDDGKLANRLTHPSFKKEKVYEVEVDKSVSENDLTKLKSGVKLEEGISRFDIIEPQGSKQFTLILHQGWNRQIRRTFLALGYKVTKLHRTKFGNYALGNLKPGEFTQIDH